MTINVPLQLISLHDDGYHLLLDITVYGSTFKVVLDTGASRTAFDKTLLLQANENALLVSTDLLSSGLGTNEMASFTAVIPDLTIGHLFIADMEVAVLDLSTINYAYRQLNHPEVLGVIGGDILITYKAVIDYGEMMLRLTL
jgi:hypothetical protein